MSRKGGLFSVFQLLSALRLIKKELSFVSPFAGLVLI